MKKLISFLLFLFILTSLVGFNTGDEIELETFLNARTSSSFDKNSKNVITTLSKGTTGEVLEIKMFPSSGNSGIKMKVMSGPNSGESYWVYYNKKNPGIKLIKKDKKEVSPENVELGPMGETKDAISAEVLRDINAKSDEAQDIAQTLETVTDTLKLETIQKLTAPEELKCEELEPIKDEKLSLSDNAQSEVKVEKQKDFDERIIQEPLKESFEPSSIQYATTCKNKNNLLWETCNNISLKDDIIPNSFRFGNMGGNSAVPNTQSADRSFSFEYPGGALSDMRLVVWDMPDGTNSHGHMKLMTFFPRVVMPAIRQSESNKDVLVVTLPTREEVLFNSKTKEILSGALTEGPMKQESRGHAKAPDIQYNGRGVVVESSALGDYPVGFEGKSGDNKKTVSIKKKGQKTCTVPEKDLWYTDKQNHNTALFNKELYTDNAFDAYVKKKCGFSIY